MMLFTKEKSSGGFYTCTGKTPPAFKAGGREQGAGEMNDEYRTEQCECARGTRVLRARRNPAKQDESMTIVEW